MTLGSMFSGQSETRKQTQFTFNILMFAKRLLFYRVCDLCPNIDYHTWWMGSMHILVNHTTLRTDHFKLNVFGENSNSMTHWACCLEYCSISFWLFIFQSEFDWVALQREACPPKRGHVATIAHKYLFF